MRPYWSAAQRLCYTQAMFISARTDFSLQPPRSCPLLIHPRGREQLCRAAGFVLLFDWHSMPSACLQHRREEGREGRKEILSLWNNPLFPWCLLKHLIILYVTYLAWHRFEFVSSRQMKEPFINNLFIPLLPLLLWDLHTLQIRQILVSVLGSKSPCRFSYPLLCTFAGFQCYVLKLRYWGIIEYSSAVSQVLQMEVYLPLYLSITCSYI